MAGNITFAMIKPAAVAKGYTGPILKMVSDGGFRIKALKMTQMSKEQAETFYGIHKEKSFFPILTGIMSSGPIIAMILEHNDAVESWRNYIGATNPANAAEGTIRKLYGESLDHNAVHGSDSDENALIESAYFFSEFERF